MRPTIFLFDIDGTLIRTRGVGKRALVRALAQHGAVDCATFPFAGMTDRLIVRRSLQIAGRAQVDESVIDAVLADYVAALREEVAAAPDGDYQIHSGVGAALDAVASAAGPVAVGLGTGNIRAGAEIKLGRVGLAGRFAFGGFGDDAEARAELLRIGAARGARRLDEPPERCRVVVIGDTPSDIEGAKAIGAECLAVATGPFEPEQLRAHEPEHVLRDLAAPGALQALLDSA